MIDMVDGLENSVTILNVYAMTQFNSKRTLNFTSRIVIRPIWQQYYLISILYILEHLKIYALNNVLVQKIGISSLQY